MFLTGLTFLPVLVSVLGGRPRALRAVLQVLGHTRPPLGLPLALGASGGGLGRSIPTLDLELRADTAGTCFSPWPQSPTRVGGVGVARPSLNFWPKEELTSFAPRPSHPQPLPPPTAFTVPPGGRGGRAAIEEPNFMEGQTRGLHCLWGWGEKVVHRAPSRLPEKSSMQ